VSILIFLIKGIQKYDKFKITGYPKSLLVSMEDLVFYAICLQAREGRIYCKVD
jgi:hypothetical protein